MPKDNNRLLNVVATRAKMFYSHMSSMVPNPNKLTASVGELDPITLENIQDDPHVASCIQSRKAGVLTQAYEIIPPVGIQVDDSVLRAVQHLFSNLKVSKIISEMLDATLYGFQPLEIYWRPEIFEGNTFFMPKDVVAKPANWFMFDSNGFLKIRTVLNPNGELCEPMKFLLVQNNANYINPYGKSILSKCLWPVAFKKGGLTFWVQMAERFGMPFIVAFTDAVADTDEYDELLEGLEDLYQGNSMATSSRNKIEVYNGLQSITVNVYKELLEFCNTEISKAILAQTLTTEIQGTGSYAAGKVHANVRQDIVDADKELVINAFNQLIRWFVNVNFGAEIPAPVFILSTKEDVDKPLAEVVNQLKDVIDFKLKFFTNRFGWSLDEIGVKATQPTIQGLLGGNKFAETNQTPTDQSLIDVAGDKVTSNDANILDPMLTRIEEIIATSNNFEDAQKNILDEFHTLLPSDLQEKLIGLLFTADTTGRLSVKEETNE